MDFGFFFIKGAEHITDINGYDHILFVLALCAVYPLRQWKTVAWLVTAFTLGHSLALALAVLQWIRADSAWVEFLIPVTILLTCLANMAEGSRPRGARLYTMAALFGLIHGLGFSNYIREMLLDEESIALPLFAFNLGLEAGQLLIVAAALALNFLFLQVARLPHRWWNLGLSAGIGLTALWMAVERW